jgi:hypothetical protein
VRAGDLLVIAGGANAGEYVVDTIASETVLTVLAGFPAALGPGSSNWAVRDELAPSFGFVDDIALPPAQVGRVYVAEGVLAAGPVLTGFRVYAKHGVFDSGDRTITGPIPYGGNAGSLIDTIDHNLGAVPTEVDVFVTSAVGSPPYLKEPSVTFDHGGPIGREPALLVTADRLQIKVYAIDSQTPRRFFTDAAGVDQAGGGLRVIARR